MVVATTFGSNVARLKTLAEAARAADRTICVLGRSMKRMISAAEEAGVLSGFPATVSPEEALEVPRRNLMLLVTGSQGERRAASAQLSRGKYLGIEMKEGDTFLFSSKTIPGNEREVLRVWNAFSEMGVKVIDDAGGKYHVSGHANRPDLEHVHRLVLPDMLIPMHGEHRHLREHARIATEAGIAAEVATERDDDRPDRRCAGSGGICRDRAVYLDGTALIGALDGVVRDRIRMALNGHALVTVLLDETDQPMGEPWVELMGLPSTGRASVRWPRRWRPIWPNSSTGRAASFCATTSQA
jgi:ribonuclease J